MKENNSMVLNFSDEDVQPNSSSIFLAGPTLRNSSFKHSWRKDAIKFLEEAEFDGIVFIPEYSENKKFIESEQSIIDETHWEWEALKYAGVIMFWVPRNLDTLPGFTTNIEFGRYMEMKPESIVLGYPKEAVKMTYLDLLYREKTNRISTNTLAGTVVKAVTILDELKQKGF